MSKQFQCIVFSKQYITIRSQGSSVSIVSDYGLAFKGRDPIRIQIVTDIKTTEQVNSFSYLGNLIYYENEMDTDNKLNDCLKITGVINNVFRPKKIRIKLYNTLSLPTLLNGCEN
jgi:hypothetical protein